MRSTFLRISYLVSVILAALSFYFFDLGQYFQIEYLIQFLNYIQEHGFLSAFLLSLILIIFSLLNLPTFYFSVLFGYLFGFVPGLVISLISRTLGVIFAYYNIHFLFFDVFTKKYGKHEYIEKINRLIKEKGFSAVVILRSLYVFPTSFLNAAFSISKIKPSTYFWASAIGLLPTSLINVSVGYLIAQNENLSENPLIIALSISLAVALISFSLLYMRKLKKD